MDRQWCAHRLQGTFSSALPPPFTGPAASAAGTSRAAFPSSAAFSLPLPCRSTHHFCHSTFKPCHEVLPNILMYCSNTSWTCQLQNVLKLTCMHLAVCLHSEDHGHPHRCIPRTVCSQSWCKKPKLACESSALHTGWSQCACLCH